MKRSLGFKVVFLACLVFAAGAVNPLFAASKKSKKSEKQNTELKADKTEKSEKSEKAEKNEPFIDWKYKGFGKQLPEWLNPALAGNEAKVRESLQLPEDCEIVIYSAAGINLDQAEQKAKQEVTVTYKLVEDFWVRANEKLKKTEEPYISVYIYKKTE